MNDGLRNRALAYARQRALVALRRAAEWRATSNLKKRAALWATLQAYLSQTKSTGCGSIDYWHLYSLVRSLKPIEVLECGTGSTTVVIAHALMENEQESGRRGRVTSMEEGQSWFDDAHRLLPDRCRPYVELVLSPTVDDFFSTFRGVRYRDVPARPYEFVFVDGPSYRSRSDGTPTFDFDFVHVLRTSERPVAGLIDQRVSTCFVLQQLLGVEKVRYSPVLGLGFISATSRKDLGQLPDKLSSANFAPSFKALGSTRLSMHPVDPEQ